MASHHEDELFILINELVGGDPRRGYLCQRICHLAATMVEDETQRGRRRLIELVVDAAATNPGDVWNPGQPPTPPDYPL